jgi:hypothetical protein
MQKMETSMRSIKKLSLSVGLIISALYFYACGDDVTRQRTLTGVLYDLDNYGIFVACVDSDPGGNGKSNDRSVDVSAATAEISSRSCSVPGTGLVLLVTAPSGIATPGSQITLENICLDKTVLALVNPDGSFQAEISLNEGDLLVVKTDFLVQINTAISPVSLSLLDMN